MRKPDEIRNAFAPTSSLNGLSSFFLVGIGGAGMSALARMLKKRGFLVRGSDMSGSLELHRLALEGIPAHIGHAEEPIIDYETRPHALVLTDAVDLEFSPEVAAARRLGIPIVRRSQALGWLLKPYKVIAVTGTHGKTTTTGMLGAGLIAAGLDPLVVVGASIPQWGGPVREGQGEFAVVEACEAYDSFHDLDPYLVLLTNLELDHVDFHGDYESLRASVVRFVNSLGAGGCLVYCADDRGASEVAEFAEVQALGYGRSETWLKQISNKFDLALKENAHVAARKTILAIPGEHNKLNAEGALMVAALLQSAGVSINLDTAEQGIACFSGAERRLQTLQDGDVVVIDDYAHHPTEVQASLSALRSRYFEGDPRSQRQGRLIAVFQPHLYSRTAGMVKEFAAALDYADEVFLTDIYPARETPKPGVSSSLIAENLKKPVHYISSRYLLPRAVARFVQPGDVVVGMGAGNISEFAPTLIEELNRRTELGWFPRRGGEANTPLRVAVLYGGDSAEREVSLHSGRAVGAALTRLGYEVSLIDLTEHLFGKGRLPIELGASRPGAYRPDVVFLAVHGTHAEDGAIQGLLELLHIPYTGSGIQASAIAMDKGLTKLVLASQGIRVPRGVVLDNPDQPFGIRAPLIVKPNAQGSTVGLSFVEKGGDACSAVLKAFSYDEEWIVGVEISIPVLNGEALAPVEIVPKGGRYDFESKYAPGATDEIIPARIGEPLIREAQRIALQAHHALGCAGATRTDAIVCEDQIVVLEVNTLPGMTPTSLLPNSAAACGITFEDLCDRILEDALRRDAAKR
jgi:UDP-N-acetylmuramate--L-alanine ligase